MTRFHNPALRTFGNNRTALTTLPTDFALESFTNECNTLIRYIDDAALNNPALEGFGKIKNVIVDTVRAIFTKIRELINRFLAWFKDTSKNDKKKAEVASRKVGTVYHQFSRQFDDPTTREAAKDMLRQNKLLPADVINMFIHDEKRDAICNALLIDAPVFSINFFAVDIYKRDDIIDTARLLVIDDGTYQLDEVIQSLLDGNDAGIDSGQVQSKLAASAQYITNRFKTLIGALVTNEPTHHLISDKTQWLSITRNALNHLTSPTDSVGYQKTKIYELMESVEQLDRNFTKCRRCTETIEKHETQLYKWESQIAKSTTDATSGHSELLKQLSDFLSVYFTTVSVAINVVNTMYKIQQDVAAAIIRNCDKVSQLLDDSRSNAKSKGVSTEALLPPFKHKLQLTLESISFQDGKFFAALVAKIDELRQSKNYSPKAIEKLGIDQLVMDHTGMCVRFSIDPAKHANAYILFPHLDKNHPFFPMQWRDMLPTEAIAMIRAGGGEIKGWVDLEQARVGGIYSKVEAVTKVTKGLIEDSKYTTPEICGIISHELGHLFTYFEMFGRINRTSNITAALSRAIFSMEDQNQRETIIKEAARALQISIEDPAELARLPAGKREDVLTTVFVTKAVHMSRSETGFHAYEMRSCEQLADDFAIRMGAGSNLATGLHKLYSSYGESSTINPVKHTIMQLITTFVYMGIGAFGAYVTLATGAVVGLGVAIACGAVAIPLLILLLSNPNEKIYDNGEDRIMLMKRTLVSAIKSKDISDDLRKSYADEIAAIDSIVKGMDYKRGIFEYIITTFGVRGSREYRQEKIMKDVELLLTNDLFVHANQLRVGA